MDRAVSKAGGSTDMPEAGGGRLQQATLHRLCDMVVRCRLAYSDIAEEIENKAYKLWKQGDFDHAVGELERVAAFFEQLPNKSEENTADLANVYFLIGQLYQYAEWYPESIEWLSKSIFADDGDPMPYHCMGISYLRTGNFHNAIRCFEQELSIDQGNYFTYILLSDLYEKEGKLEKAEERLKELLNRNPENIQALHRLIRHYERHNPACDVNLLRKRLLGIGKKCNAAEAAIRAYHLSSQKSYGEAMAMLTAWKMNNSPSPVLHLTAAYVRGMQKRPGDRSKELATFRELCGGRKEVMDEQVDEFRGLFGDELASHFSGLLEKKAPRRRTKKAFNRAGGTPAVPRRTIIQKASRLSSEATDGGQRFA